MSATPTPTQPTLTRGSTLVRIDVLRGGAILRADTLNEILATTCEAPEMAHAPFLYSCPVMAKHVHDTLAFMLEPLNYRVRMVVGTR